MEKREARVYYVQEREGRKAILVFDTGHAGGDVHIYEYKRSCSVKDIQEEIKTQFRVSTLSKAAQEAMVEMWIEKNIGFPISWKLIPV